MALHITNEHGSTVPAIGAPGSLRRLQCEHPSTWPIRVDAKMLDDATSGTPTHVLPLKEEGSEATLREPVWELGEVEHNYGSSTIREFVYAVRPSWRPVAERYAEVYYTPIPLEPFRYLFS